MADLKVDFMGIKLKNPLIVGSSTMTKNIGGLLKAEESGAGAVVLKSLFEEELSEDLALSDDYHPEAFEYFLNDTSKLYGSTKYLDFIKEAKDKLFIPVIASVNCLGGKWWVDYARQIEDAGADALELNIAYIPFSIKEDPRDIEKKYVEIVSSVRNAIKIPLAVKIGYYFTSVPLMVKKLKDAGANGITMFNKFFRMSIDVENMKFHGLEVYSCVEETYQVLRYVAVCNNQINIDISASTGIHNSNIALQHLMAGAKTFQIVSAIYKKGYGVIPEIVNDINNYLDRKHFKSVNDIIGVATKFDGGFKAFERIQYMKYAGDRY
ncbi:MAG: dihydroorotate oxidase [Calditerrivibrio nitroreducens]|uniref:dihydrouracil dehydrogenase (NAD(+)) n=1 Tax=Calditerrivibrio nitroreducens TaxID=477976 RepID=A0A2J6WQV3_9BACT|nr:MAG: dihydroorotate oxidase [Calditerrivibrio nitroreducens]